MPTVSVTLISITPLAAIGPAPCTVTYSFSVTLTKAEFLYFAGVLQAATEAATGVATTGLTVNYAEGTVTLLGPSPTYPLTTPVLSVSSVTGLWGEDSFSLGTVSMNDDKLVQGKDRLTFPLAGLVTIAPGAIPPGPNRTFTVTARSINEDSVGNDEVYAAVTVTFPDGSTAEGYSAPVVGTWSSFF